MNTDMALGALAALAHPTRLEAFRLLIQQEPEGLSTGQLVEASGLSQSTFSTILPALPTVGPVHPDNRARQYTQPATIAPPPASASSPQQSCRPARAHLSHPSP